MPSLLPIASLLLRSHCPWSLRLAPPVLAVCLLAILPIAIATPSASARQAPGYYHQQIGPLQITALFDGIVALPRKELQGIEPDRIQALLQRGFVPEKANGVQTTVNAYLINDGRRLTLVDTGTAACFGPGLGQVLGNLRAAGYDPARVDAVLLTHAHPDHLCGLLDAQGKPAYPNATVWLSKRDADFWLDPARETHPDTRAPHKPLFKMARDAVAPYRAAKHLRLFEERERMIAGSEVLPSYGHSPGHVSYLFGTAQQPRVLVWGDIVHSHAVQFADPGAWYAIDADRDQAIAARRDLMARAARQTWWVAGAHLPFPGLGHVRGEGQGFTWVPAEYAPLPAGPEPQ